MLGGRRAEGDRYREEAIAECRTVVGQRSPRVAAAVRAQAWFLLGSLLDDLPERYEEAVDAYRQGLALEDFVVAHNNLGAILVAQGRPEEAEQHFLRAAELRPAYTTAYQNLAKLYFRWDDGTRLLDGVRRMASGGGGRAAEGLHRFVLALVEFTRRDAYEDFYGRGHRLKNLLAIIQSRLQRVHRRMAAGEGDPREAEREVLALGESVGEASTELCRYLDVIRPAPAAPQPVDLNSVVMTVGARLRQGLPPGVRLNVDLAADVPRVTGTPGVLDEAIMNLARNAVEAVGGQGAVALVTCFDPARVEALVAVDDSGPGIPETRRRDVFRPGFTTKPGGTGLGLPLVQRAAQDVGGSVSVDRSELGGARLLLRIPAVEGAGAVAGRSLADRPVSLPDTTSLLADELTR